MDAERVVEKASESRLVVFLVIVVFLSGFSGCAFRACCVNFVDNYELGYIYHANTGRMEVLDRTGYIVSKPFIDSVHTIDLRPVQVCISANKRVLNCKLVRFNKAGIELFLQWHGRGDYDTVPDAEGKPSTFGQIMMTYAYDETGATYPFLQIVSDLKQNVPPPVQK